MRRSLREFKPAPAIGRGGKGVGYGVGKDGSKRGSAGGLGIKVGVTVDIVPCSKYFKFLKSYKWDVGCSEYITTFKSHSKWLHAKAVSVTSKHDLSHAFVFKSLFVFISITCITEFIVVQIPAIML